MSELTRLRDEAARLHGVYEEYSNSSDEALRRKAHVDLDRFLMENRETAVLLMIDGLDREIEQLRLSLDLEYEKIHKTSMFKKLLGKVRLRRGAEATQSNAATHD